jgi:hypothetical protein
VRTSTLTSVTSSVLDRLCSQTPLIYLISFYHSAGDQASHANNSFISTSFKFVWRHNRFAKLKTIEPKLQSISH